MKFTIENIAKTLSAQEGFYSHTVTDLQGAERKKLELMIGVLNDDDADPLTIRAIVEEWLGPKDAFLRYFRSKVALVCGRLRSQPGPSICDN